MKLAEILTGPETWCKHTLSTRDHSRRCLIGAVMEIAHPVEWKKERERLSRVITEVTGQAIKYRCVQGDRLSESDGIAQWQDTRSWDDIMPVVEAYDRDRMLNP